MTDTRLHLRILEGFNVDRRTICGLKADRIRSQSIYWSEFERARHMDGDVCAECSRVGAYPAANARLRHDRVHALGTFWARSEEYPTVCHYHGHCVAPEHHDHVDMLGDGAGWHEADDDAND